MQKRIVLVAFTIFLVLALIFLVLKRDRKSTYTEPDFPNRDSAQGCVRAGCSGELCVEASVANDLMSTCEFKPEYACYQEATCAVLEDGSCGFFQTPELLECLENVSQEVFSEELH